MALKSSAGYDRSLKRPASNRAPSRDSSVVTASTLARLTSDPHTTAQLQKDSVVLSNTELNNLKANARQSLARAGAAITAGKGSSANPSSSSFGGSTRSLDPAREQRAKERRDKLLKIDEERKKQDESSIGSRSLGGGGGSGSAAPEAAGSTGLAVNVGHLVEEHDDVKVMNHMILYAKCAAIRDAQILEKRISQQELEEEDKRRDLEAELDRLQTIHMSQEREKRKAEERRAGALVIVQQMKQREEERIKQAEQREQEAQVMLHRIKELEQKEEEERQGKVVANKRMLQQVMEANNQQARQKLRKKQEELEEDMKISEYIKQRELREAEAEGELARIRAEKEKEVARLRALQERAIDTQSKIDELRAKRYQEAKDRSWRQQELAAAEKRDQQKREIVEARESQRIEKERQLAEQALAEKQEFLSTLYHQTAIIENEHDKVETDKVKRLQHRDEILTQIKERERKKQIERKKFLSEADIYTKQQQEEAAKVNAVKQEKIEAMKRVGVPEKYQAQLAKFKVLQNSVFK